MHDPPRMHDREPKYCSDPASKNQWQNRAHCLEGMAVRVGELFDVTGSVRFKKNIGKYNHTGSVCV